ncbi:hypothetical protein D9619_005896 [Psilocybe cf. subviscida]|uniref:Heat shock protein 9/12-domain-containing protein n=1 Tax=Psilocybe cf. subviscida TaxID=2480587 RepID=A0A8H5BXE2_9AGAR|nr:hypothetical protein D9619_005896 [Psilocybe cf. subviscida]
MSDANRQSFTDKAGAAMKPDSQKSTLEQAGDFVKGKSDNAASSVQPNNSKSGSQKAGDAMTGSSSGNSESLLDQAKHAVGMGNK